MIEEFLGEVGVQQGVSRMAEVSTHDLRKSHGERYLVLKDVPFVVLRFFRNLSNRARSLRATTISAVVIRRVVYDYPCHVYGMASISSPEIIK